MKHMQYEKGSNTLWSQDELPLWYGFNATM
jgi:hypothetical protein